MAKARFQRTKPHVSCTVAKLQKLGMSRLGAMQAATGKIIINREDRALIAFVVGGAVQSGDIPPVDQVSMNFREINWR
jgi:hypothetical protein